MEKLNQMKSYMAKPGEVPVKWYVVDATDKVCGRMATRIARILMGKHRPEYTPHVDTGEFVIVVNAEKVRLTGTNKWTQRTYQTFSGYPGGQKTLTAEEMLVKHPTRIVEDAIRRMLPKNRLGRAMFSKLKVYAGPEHKHQAQQPEPLEM